MHLAVNGFRESEGGPEIDRRDELLTEITACQRPLFAYIRTLIGPGSDVDDILQEVNLILWRKRDEFDGRGRFLTWACHIAYLQVLAHCKRRRREQSVFFDEDVLEGLAGCLAQEVERLDVRVEALRECLAKLPPARRRVILRRYEGDGSVERMADELGRPVGSLKVSLYRIRRMLGDCIARTLGEDRRG
jgi:RNA polymerase sigma-70 factor (ECF subfamily)